MKLQLTKDKTIEIKLPGGGSSGVKTINDITGVELFSGQEAGCPAVRLVFKKKQWQVASLGFITPPDGAMPESWEDAVKQPHWDFPKKFLSPHAALAVNSAMGSFAQGTPDAIIHEMVNGPAAVPSVTNSAPTEKKRFGIRRAESAPAPAPTMTAPAPTNKTPDFPEAGNPVSENGRRFVVKPLAEEGFHLSASLPEFQTLWLSRLLIEGKRPTANSIQLSESALMASVLAQPLFKELEGNVLAIFVMRNCVYIAGYKGGEPVLWRRCPGVLGYEAMRMKVITTLGIGEDLVEAVLNESLIDPRPALEPFVHPVLDQLDLTRAYLSSKHGMKIDKALLMGFSLGATHWCTYAKETLNLEMVTPNPFEGLPLLKGVEAKDPNAYLVALGAALAAAEVEL